MMTGKKVNLGNGFKHTEMCFRLVGVGNGSEWARKLEKYFITFQMFLLFLFLVSLKKMCCCFSLCVFFGINSLEARAPRSVSGSVRLSIVEFREAKDLCSKPKVFVIFLSLFRRREGFFGVCVIVIKDLLCLWQMPSSTLWTFPHCPS